MRSRRADAFAACLTVGLLIGSAAEAADLRVFHIGSSATDVIGYDASRTGTMTMSDGLVVERRFVTGNYRSLDTWAEARGNNYSYDRHVIPGAPLDWLWDVANNQKSNPIPFDQHDTRLRNQSWDAVIMQIGDRSINATATYAQKFIDETGRNADNADSVFYMFERWPKRSFNNGTGSYNPIDYAAAWTSSYGTNYDRTSNVYTRDYSRRLVEELREQNDELPPHAIRLIPVGEVLYEIDQLMRAGGVPGYTSVDSFYADGTHFYTAPGKYVAAATFYATLFNDSPVGLDPMAYGFTDTTTAAIFADVVWDVVSNHPYALAPQQIPAPATALLLAPSAMLMLGMRRGRGSTPDTAAADRERRCR